MQLVIWNIILSQVPLDCDTMYLRHFFTCKLYVKQPSHSEFINWLACFVCSVTFLSPLEI